MRDREQLSYQRINATASDIESGERLNRFQYEMQREKKTVRTEEVLR